MPLPDGDLKRLSEGKHITANPKHASEFNFVNRAVPMILSNHWPPSRDTSRAIRERAQVVDFTRYIAPAERDELARQIILERELPGVLNRWLAGYARVQEHGGFAPPVGCERAKEHWSALSNPVMMFIKELIVADPKGFTQAADLWEGYRNWLRFSSPGSPSLKRHTFYERMDSLLGERVKKKGQMGWKGYKLNEDSYGEF